MGVRAEQDRMGRRAMGTARGLLIYGLLIGGSFVFALPFIWMVGTSFKVDREMFGEQITLWPTAPRPVAKSPYLDTHYFPLPRDARYEQVLPVIRKALGGMELPLPAHAQGVDEAVDVLAPGIFKKLAERFPAQSWKLPPGRLAGEVRAAITEELVAEIAGRVYRRFTLGRVRVRSLDVQEVEVTEGKRISEFWQLGDEANARFVDDDSGRHADVLYDLTEADRLTLSSTVSLPFSAERLFRVQVFFRPDDSWHPVEFFVERNGKRYESKLPQYLGDYRWIAVSLQEFVDKGQRYEPDLSKIRLWLVMHEVAQGAQFESRPDHIKIEMIMSRNSKSGAWWAKCSRNYRGALNYIPFWRYAATSAFLVILNIVGTVFSCSLVAYAFARLRWPGRNFCFGLMLATMMVPPQVTMIPYFLIMKHLGWYNTLRPLWIPSFFANAFGVFLLRQFMKGIPQDIEDAARIDGCNFLQIYWYVMLPLVKPTLACIAIFTFMGVWNDFMGPLIYVSDQRLYPLSLGLYAFNVQAGGSFGMMMAGSMMMTLPVIIIFFFAQKYFIQGITLTGMKG